MRVTVVTPPEPVVMWEDADAHLNLDGDTTRQAEVEAMIAAATAHIDGPSGWLGRALGVQTLEMRMPAFGTCGFIGLPYPPAIEIMAVDYVDAAGATITVDAGDYDLRGNMLRPAWPKAFPTAAWRGGHGETVRIRWTAGYDELPAPIRAAILLMVGDLFRFRDTVAAGPATSVPISTTVERLLGPYRVYA